MSWFQRYKEGTPFFRMRVWIVGIGLIDLFATLVFLLFFSGPPLGLEVWYEPSFPSNMLMLRNLNGKPLEHLHLVLDNQYEADVEILEPGPNGLEIAKLFVNKDNKPAKENYRPRQLEIRSQKNATVIVPLMERRSDNN